MTRLVLGIIAVFSLQVAFMTYQSIDRWFGSVGSTVGEVTAELLPIAEVAIADVAEEPAPGKPTELKKPGYLAKTERRRRAQLAFTAVRKTPVAPRHPVRDQAAADMKPVVIEYKGPPRKTYGSEHIAARSDRPRPEKRSFFARTLSIVKKPYSWLKAVGSKLR
ncbi:MAG TPA: hypothetical protein VNA17_09865 [Pyrinomonadaceae bacterium]|nr:hypothetical protein [Pyrinomonadaceae bacterium]